ncbi:polysaccharide lyase family 1 protein [Saccharata proteae CBS 121410]|uniref:pectin lyase n=1 Tax=Saccharata proteae CBS 121410 TaxID=1314787 RepID=A0A9P4HT26_9PEZI|nr:polysaccharide lyase family 1 protein [Saccharata proteae CBS 121410]
MALFNPAPLAHQALAVGVVGSAEGFASGVTGGGDATPVYPSSIDELVSYLGDDEARVIVLDQEFNFIDSEGTTTEEGCRPASNTCPDDGGQDAINNADWCTNGDAGDGATTIEVTYDNAAILGITVNSDKTLIGVGSSGVIKGKGLRMVSGVSNIIIQNVRITDLNPQYIWGGDAITVDDADLIWIDHCKIDLIGRQMLVLGTEADNRVTVSYNDFDGATDWSATCDGHHYWTIYLDGSSDMVTMKGNYIHTTSGRSPKIQDNTLLHAVNNYWYDNTGHAFDVGEGGMAVVEGNVFQNVDTVLLENLGSVFSAPDTSTNTVCADYLDHDCVLNSFGSSGTLDEADTAFLVNFEGKNIATVSAASAVSTASAGVGVVS